MAKWDGCPVVACKNDLCITGCRERARRLINELAPVTRRDEWWATDGPYEIIAKHFAETPIKQG